jgi:hypothetical protein
MSPCADIKHGVDCGCLLPRPVLGFALPALAFCTLTGYGTLVAILLPHAELPLLVVPSMNINKRLKKSNMLYLLYV